MSLNAHYEDELSYLRELGQEFARANPKLAGFLAREASDPDVERLLEGFAFSVAQLRQKLDDEMPEFAHGLIRLIWPHYLRPLPPMTIVAFAVEGGGADPVSVPSGTALASRPIEGVSCRFRTCYPVDVLPFRVSQTTSESQASGATLSVTLRATGRASLQALRGGRLRLFFNAEREPQVSRTLMLWLSRHLQSVSVTSETGESLNLAADAVRPAGFGEAEAVIPYPSNAFAGFRLIQEYLAFPAKFLFVDIEGLAPVGAMAGRSVTFTFTFSRAFPDQIRVVNGHIRINCTPVINLFPHEAQPLRVDRSRTEYRVVPYRQAETAIYAIERVMGHVQGRGDRIVYEPFEAFRHDLPDETALRPFYRERLQPAVVGRGVDHYLSFVTPRDAPAPPDQVVSVALTCTNGLLAERLPIGALDRPTSETPATVSFTNLRAVTPHIPPPIGESLLWRLISNLACNFGSLTDVGSLRSLIASYDFRAVHDAQARHRLELLLAGIEGFEHGVEDGVLRGQPVRLRSLRLSLAESKVGGEAEMHLFGSVLERFFAVYAGLNSLHRFAIQGIESRIEYKWKPRRGTTISR